MNTMMWRPSPKFILRRDAIRVLTRKWQPGKFLEIGAGTGTLTKLFLQSGFKGVCWDVTAENRNILRANLTQFCDRIDIPEQLPTPPEREFDYLFAFEVLEHIEYDQDALLEWTTRLQKGGRILLSVPAHQNKFSSEDEYVGHFRRYEKKDLASLLHRCGFHDIKIINYGFPLGNITGLLSRSLSLSGKDRANLDNDARSTKSGVSRSKSIRIVGPFCNDLTLFPFRLIQRPFFRFDIGDGYIAMATFTKT